MQGNKNQQQGNKNQQHKQRIWADPKSPASYHQHQATAGCTARMSNIKTPGAMGHTCHAGFVACIGNARLPRKSGEKPPRIEACPQGCRNMLLGDHICGTTAARRWHPRPAALAR